MTNTHSYAHEANAAYTSLRALPTESEPESAQPPANRLSAHGVPRDAYAGAMPTFLFKTEPSEFSFADLVRDRRCTWDGVTNNAALAHLRTAAAGDEVLIYHTGDEKAIVGLAKVVKKPYEDPAQPGLNAKNEPKFAVVDLAPVKAAKTPATLAQIKADKRFAEFPLVTQGRLSVMPVPPAIDKALRSLAGL